MFDADLSEERRRDLRQEARELLSVLGVVAPTAYGSSGDWRISDPALDSLASVVPAGAQLNEEAFVQRGLVALVCIDKEWCTAELVEEADLDA